MKAKDIQVDKTYINRGAGRTRRTVLAIGARYIPDLWLSDRPRPNEPGVEFEQSGNVERLYLSSFAHWARREA